jgi:CubicO group peptidase (beta-lactamase class C family)
MSFAEVEAAFAGYADADPAFSAQLAVHVGGHRMIDLSVGALHPDSLLPVYSSSKGATAVVVALLVERGQLDLEECVAHYWPEFAQRGKAAVTVSQMLSHQGGLPGVDGGYTWHDLFDHEALATRLAAQRPFWRPGAGAMYHGLTLGTLADELVRRIDGRSVGEVLRQEITGPRELDVWLGVPESEDARVVPALPPTPEELATSVPPVPDPLATLWPPRGEVAEVFTWINDPGFRRVGQAAAGLLASGRGLGGLYACLRHEVNGNPRLLSEDTISQMSQIQVATNELGSNLPIRFGVIFQAPTPPRWPFGGVGAFGHDGAGGSLAFCDPVPDIAFGYTVQRMPVPGGMDLRAVELARLVRHRVRAMV